MLIVDSSIVVDALGGDEEISVRARNALAGESLYAPNHVDIEALSAWRRHVRQGAMSKPRAAEAVANLLALPIARIPHEPLIERIWQLRDNLTTADAAYVALAESFGAVLLTNDRRMAAAPGTRCEIRVVG